MSNLPQRLRNWIDGGDDDHAIMEEAADEIDRLYGHLHDHALPITYSHLDAMGAAPRPQVLHLTMLSPGAGAAHVSLPFGEVNTVTDYAFNRKTTGCFVNQFEVRESYDEVLALLGWAKEE